MKEFLDRIFSNPGEIITTALLGLVAGIVIEKFKKRLTLLKYRLFFHPLATASHDKYWGKITVSHNGRETAHLNFVTLEILNDSNTDLENVNVDVWVDSKSQILGQNGHYVETGNAIYLEAAHFQHFQAVALRNEECQVQRVQDPSYETPESLQADIGWVTTNKKFHLPIFNRKTSIVLNLLIENFHGSEPDISLSVLHKSVKVVEMQAQDAENKRLGVIMLVCGAAFVVLSTIILYVNYPDSKNPILILGSIGVLNFIFGVLIYYVIRSIKSIFK